MSLSMCMASTDKTTFFSTTELSLSFGTVSKKRWDQRCSTFYTFDSHDALFVDVSYRKTGHKL